MTTSSPASSMKLPFGIFVLLLALAPAAYAQQQTMTATDLWKLQRVGAPVSSPDGSRAAFVVTTNDINENRANADIYMMRELGPAVRLAASPASDNSPSWGPDNRSLAFLSGRAGDKPQLFMIDSEGGEARQITRLPVTVMNPQWFPDGRRIAFVAEVPADFTGDWTALRKQLDDRSSSKVTARTTENRKFRHFDRWLPDGDSPRLFSVDIESGDVRELMPGSRRFLGFDGPEYSISPDGRQIAASVNTTDAPYHTLNFDIVLIDADGSGRSRTLTASNKGHDTRPVFSLDGRSIIYGEQRDPNYYADRVRLMRYEIASSRHTPIVDDVNISPEQWTQSRDGRTIYFHAERDGGKLVLAVPSTGGRLTEIHRGGTNDGVAVMRDRLLVQHQTMSKAPEIHEVSLKGSGFAARTHFNDAALARFNLGRVESVTYAGSGGAAIQMFIVYPPDFDASRKWPLVMQIHGGPHGASADQFHWRWNTHVFAAPGYVIALPNFHGSSGFGDAFARSIHGAWAEKPYADIMAATDYMIGRGFIDQERMAATGGSYGGYMMTWIAGSTDRFKAIVNHAGVSNAQSQWAADLDFGSAMGGSLWLNPDVLQKNNPIRLAANFKTPMLIMHGGRDYRVPSDQGLELYGVYKARGLDSRLVFYPDENHWILSAHNSIHWYGEFLGWLNRYLKGAALLSGESR
jgi:dipeptidyl aminopeptidase/acylaminoacyl peptidase